MCDIVVDVGGVYDSKKLFDHHQRSCDERMPKPVGDQKPAETHYPSKLSSAGLIWREFGLEIIKALNPQFASTVTPKELNDLYHMIYEQYILPVDQQDTGVKQGEASSIMMRIRRLNPSGKKVTDADRDAAFPTGVVTQDFLDFFNYTLRVYYHEVNPQSKKKVQQALTQARQNGHPKIFQISAGYMNTILRLPEEDIPLYITFIDTNKTHMVQAVPITKGSFVNRKSLPNPWCGLRDQDLSTVTGIPDCVFAHQNGFIGGNKTADGALEMAKLAASA